MTEITDNTPIAILTVGQLKKVLVKDTEKEAIVEKLDATEKEYVFGLKGIRDEFGISHATAQKWKDGILKRAVMQHGRKIIVDVKKARELLQAIGK